MAKRFISGILLFTRFISGILLFIVLTSLLAVSKHPTSNSSLNCACLQVACSMSIPTIDLGKWLEGDSAARVQVARDFDIAAKDVGFLQIINHGLPASTLSAILDAADRFYALPDSEKALVSPESKSVNRGYTAPNSECLALSLAVDSSKPPPPPDTFEAFNVGPDAVDYGDEYFAKERHRFFHPNLWPENLPGFREAVADYFEAANRVALVLTDLFAPALGLEKGYFEKLVDRSITTMRVINYESHGEGSSTGEQHTRSEKAQRMSAHTDYGVVTVLYGDPGVTGLQIFANNDWQDVVPDAGALLVNFGDMTAEMTNDRWRSTLHRVVPAPGRRRSIAFFLDANYDALIHPVRTCVGPERPALYPSFVAGEHLMAKVLGPRTLTQSQHTVDTVASRKAALLQAEQ